MVFGVAAALILGVASSASAGTLDQQQTDFSVGTGTIDSGETPAQTFTAGLSGGIDQVDLHLESHGPTTPVTVEIRDTSGGAPGATVLAAQSVPASSIPTAGSWVTVNFATPAPVTAGSQYAVLAYSSPVSMTQHYDWGYGGDSYAGGRFTYATSSPPSGPLDYRVHRRPRVQDLRGAAAGRHRPQEEEVQEAQAPRRLRQEALQEEEALARLGPNSHRKTVSDGACP